MPTTTTSALLAAALVFVVVVAAVAVDGVDASFKVNANFDANGDGGDAFSLDDVNALELDAPHDFAYDERSSDDGYDAPVDVMYEQQQQRQQQQQQQQQQQRSSAFDLDDADDDASMLERLAADDDDAGDSFDFAQSAGDSGAMLPHNFGWNMPYAPPTASSLVSTTKLADPSLGLASSLQSLETDTPTFKRDSGHMMTMPDGHQMWMPGGTHMVKHGAGAGAKLDPHAHAVELPSMPYAVPDAKSLLAESSSSSSHKQLHHHHIVKHDHHHHHHHHQRHAERKRMFGAITSAVSGVAGAVGGMLPGGGGGGGGGGGAPPGDSGYTHQRLNEELVPPRPPPSIVPNPSLREVRAALPYNTGFNMRGISAREAIHDDEQKIMKAEEYA